MNYLFRFVALALIAGGALPAVAGADNRCEIIRVRTPADRVSACFPPGATIRTMPTVDFEALVARAEARTNLTDRVGSSRPVRVEHRARWEDAALVGQSRITLPSTLDSDQPVVLICDPWSPVVLDSPAAADVVRVDSSGRLVLVQAPRQATRTVEIDWRQAAVAFSRGEVFALQLPEADLGTLTLDLPANATPRTPGSRLESPLNQPPDRSVWSCAGATGRFPIQVDLASSSGLLPLGPWLSGSTRIDLNGPGPNWVADWKVESSQRGPVTARVVLDRELELIDVTGPDVERYQSNATERSIVEIKLHEPETGWRQGSLITIRAQAQVPLVGPWPIPSAQPARPSEWLGGRTLVRLDPARSVVAVVERSGRRVVPPSVDPPAPPLWVFESEGRPGPLAELHLAGSAADTTVTIDGHLRMGGQSPRIDLGAVWSLDGNQSIDPTLDFPAGWVVDRVALEGDQKQKNPSWHTESLPNNVTRLHLDGTAWPVDPPSRSLAIRVGATLVSSDAGPGNSTSWELPRVRPAHGRVRIGTERWLATIDHGYTAVPEESQGLVWDDAPPVAPTEASVQQLAWRWVAPAARASVQVRVDPSQLSLDERVEATIGDGRLHLVWYWTLASSNDLANLPFWLDLDTAAAPRWRLAARPNGPAVEPLPLTPDRRGQLGWANHGVAAEIALSHFPPGVRTLRGEADLAWAGSGSIPLFRFPGPVRVRRSLVVRVRDATQCRVDRSEGLALVGRGEVGDPATTPESESSPYRAIVGDDEPGWRIANAWLGGSEPGRLDLTTLESSRNVGGVGLITEAWLTSRLAPGSPSRHRLVLRVSPGTARTLDFKLPIGATLDRVRLDGQPALVTSDGPMLRINLTRSDLNRLNSTITLDYRTLASSSLAGLVRPVEFLPTTPLACFSFVWQVNAPNSTTVRSESPDLIATDLDADLAGSMGLDQRLDQNPAMIADLNQALTSVPPSETTLGEWFVKLDAGQWPLVIDRLALLSVGLGPKSRVNITGTDSTANPPQSAPAVFNSLGLAIEPMGATFLVTTVADRQNNAAQARPTAAQRAELGNLLLTASINGSDRSDRFQAPSRWRSEPTPRAWLASETPDRGLVALGWRTHRFAASSWPARTLAIRLIDAQDSWRPLGWVAITIGTLGLLLGACQVAARHGRLQRTIGMVLILVAAGPALAHRDQAGPILVAFPYANLSQIDAAPDRVVLLANDYDRLIQLASPLEPLAPVPTALVAVSHLVVPNPRQGAAIVTSRVVLDVSGPTAGSWSFPVGSAVDLTATVAGQSVPLLISPDGTVATIAAIPIGRSEVVVSRSVPIRIQPEQIAGWIDLPIGRAAVAQVELDTRSLAEPRLCELPNLVGRSTWHDGIMVGELGPVDRLIARWGPTDQDHEPHPTLSTLVRWEAIPSGDDLTARLTVLGSVPARTLRLGLESGLAVIGQAIPNLVGISTGGNPDRPEWVAHLDPPLLPGSTAEIHFWRARTDHAGSLRPYPRWDILDATTSVSIGLEAPDGWMGRILRPHDEPLLGPTLFARNWGRPPPQGFRLTDETAVHSARPIVAEVAREPSRVSVRDRALIKVGSISIPVVVDSIFNLTGEPIWELAATFDHPVRVDRVLASNLTGWSQPSSTQIRLNFAGIESGQNLAVHLEGTVLVAASGPNSTVETVVPWPRWRGVEPDLGDLTLEAPDGWSVQTGGAPLRPDPPSGGITELGKPQLTHYSVRRDGGPLQLTGPDLPPRVNVTIASDLCLEAGRAVWSADVDCEITGGGVQVFYWRLPTEWAQLAQLQTSDGSTPRLEVENRGEYTVWAITFPQPAWSCRKLQIVAVRSITPGATLHYPEIVPLSAPGRGAVDQYDLTITNLAGLPIELLNPQGLAPLNHSRVRSEPSAVPGGVVSRAFRVKSDPWSLELSLSADPVTDRTETQESHYQQRLAAVERVDFQATLDSSGRLQGRADCRVQPGDFVAVNLSATAILVGAIVEGRLVTPVPAQPETPNRWLIPLGNHGGKRVAFCWIEPPSNSPTAFVPLPAFDRSPVPTTVKVASTALGSTLTLTGGDWRRLDAAAARLQRFQALGTDLIAASAGAEPTATNLGASAALLDRLMTFQLELRAASRAAKGARGAAPSAMPEWLTVQDQVQTALLTAGLGSVLEEARQRVDLASPEVDSVHAPILDELPGSFPIRQIGSLEYFEGLTARDQPAGFNRVSGR